MSRFLRVPVQDPGLGSGSKVKGLGPDFRSRHLNEMLFSYRNQSFDLQGKLIDWFL